MAGVKSLGQKIEEMRERHVDKYVRSVDAVMSSMDSPIEVALLWGMLASTAGSNFDGCWPEDGEYGPVPPGADGKRGWICLGMGLAAVAPQLEVTAGKKRYRIDLAVRWCRTSRSGVDRVAWVAVECDGHDFHEKTKEQAARDKERDRDLQQIGWRVIHFTGSEIYRDPSGTAEKVWHFCHQVANQG